MADNELTRKDAEMLWYLGSMNDGLFIINTPPRPSTDDQFHDRKDGPTIVLNVTELPIEKAKEIVDTHNLALRALQHSPARVAEDALWNEEIDAMHSRADELDEDGMPDTANWLRDTAHRLTTYHKAPESPAKEQPGEQNASSTEKGGAHAQTNSGTVAVAGVASAQTRNLAPDVAAMVKRLEQFAFHLRTIENQYAETMREKIDRDAAELMDQAAALIEKLGQGWIPVEAIPPLAENAYGLQELYARNSYGKCFKLVLPPPPERP